MRESIGSTFLYNIIILFIIVTFAFLSGTLAYMKAFKANSRIINAIEKYEGYNYESANEISNTLLTLGYTTGKTDCPFKTNGEIVEQVGEQNYQFCIYKFSSVDSANKDYYGVVTYMRFNFPVVGEFKIPLYAKTEKVYKFPKS